MEDADELILFLDVRIIDATARTLRCGIGDKRVWLPRFHVSGKLWSAGDRGKLFIRRWVARDRGLIAPLEATAGGEPPIVRYLNGDPLHVVRAAPAITVGGVVPAPRATRASAPRGRLSSTSGPHDCVVAAGERGPFRVPPTSLVERRRLRKEVATTAPGAGPVWRQ